MKYTISLILLFSFLKIYAQPSYQVQYERSYNDKLQNDSDTLLVYSSSKQTIITSSKVLRNKASYPFETFYINREDNLAYIRATRFSPNKELATIDSTIFNKQKFTLSDETRNILGYTCKKATTSVNSNHIEIWYTNDLNIFGGPNELGQQLGLVLEYVRNGNTKITASHLTKIDHIPSQLSLAPYHQKVDGLSYQDEVWKSRFIQIPIFENEQIHYNEQISSDSVLRFANGTVILKKIRIPEVKNGSQAFIQLIEKSNGDAYDRTGSVFLIADDQAQNFLHGMQNGMSTLPMYDNGDGKEYPGMVRTAGYSPIYELMRFFTPFGVSHFNDRLTLKGKTWQDSAFYRQDISEFLSVLSGKDVYIGTYIGNYDKGGHKVSLELTIHPGYSNEPPRRVLSLFNSTNVMEMGGQTYATFFSQEKGLEVKFELEEDAKDVQLRYITTGHGGWGKGDEFVPKENSIYINDKLHFKFIPWRTDCGSYRLYNPVSGNFQNGLSSSDLSRSNWCPGSVTTPNYINLGDLKAGNHKIRIQIPQGEPEGSSFSFWNVSGTLLYR